jgi:hypothetical protein
MVNKNNKIHFVYQNNTNNCQAKGENVEYSTTAEDGIKNMKVIDDIYTKAGMKVRGNVV